MSLTTASGIKSDYGAFDAADSMFAAQFDPDNDFFFGFIGREELVGIAGQPQVGDGNLMLVSLGIVTYNFACLRDEKSRLGSDFFWGIENAIVPTSGGGTVTTVSGVIYPEVEVIQGSFDFMEDLEAWQRYLAYITFGLNILFLTCLVVWCCCRCRICCGGRHAEIQRFKMKLLNRQAHKQMSDRKADESARLELAQKTTSLALNILEEQKHRFPNRPPKDDQDQLAHAMRKQPTGVKGNEKR